MRHSLHARADVVMGSRNAVEIFLTRVDDHPLAARAVSSWIPGYVACLFLYFAMLFPSKPDSIVRRYLMLIHHIGVCMYELLALISASRQAT
jgi:hypothetical protein